MEVSASSWFRGGKEALVKLLGLPTFGAGALLSDLPGEDGGLVSLLLKTKQSKTKTSTIPEHSRANSSTVPYPSFPEYIYTQTHNFILNYVFMYVHTYFKIFIFYYVCVCAHMFKFYF